MRERILKELQNLDKKTAPPMLFEELVAAELEEEIRPELKHLLELKKTLPEIGIGDKNPVIDAYIERMLPEKKRIADTIEDLASAWDTLNALFLRMVRQ